MLLLRRLPAPTRLFLHLFLLLLAYFALMRLGLVWRNRASAVSTTWGDLLAAFRIGLRFDIAVACYLLLPFVVTAHLPFVGLDGLPRCRRTFIWTFTATLGIVTLILLAEYEFFREFQTRYNQLAIEYLGQGSTVAGMVWYNYPIVRYLLAWAAVVVAIALVLRWLVRRSFATDAPWRWDRLIALAALIPVMVVGMRGGLQGEPLRWGDAHRTRNDFADEMGLNGLFTLGISARDRFKAGHAHSAWRHGILIADARRTVREMLLAPGERLLDPDNRTVLRSGLPDRPSATLRKTGRPVNVVLILMESFSARFCGAAGSPDDFTPSFNRLAHDGIFFDRAFSSGTHTHQGVFSTILGFPNLPGYEYLMQNMAARQPFRSLPSIFAERGYRTLFLYNGQFAWDNMRGFFHTQGIERFIGDGDYVNPIHRDKVWGVSDLDVFRRADAEFADAARSGPFFGIILTLSNHAPFDVPLPPGIPRTRGMGELDRRLDGVRYADWALGQFFEAARQRDYFRDTLFVLVGDHGFHVMPVLGDVHPLYHHVPLLFYAPELLEPRGVTRHRTAGQMNVLPSILGLLELDVPHASWGRNLFCEAYADEGFVVFKGSGGTPEVALLSGDAMLVIAPGRPSVLGRLNMGFPPTLAPRNDPALMDRMTRELKAYVGTSLSDLVERRAGPAPADK